MLRSARTAGRAHCRPRPASSLRGADQARVPLIAEPADHAIRGAPFLGFEHGALARLINPVEMLGNHAVERGAARLEPALRFCGVAREWRKPHRFRGVDRLKKGLE